MGKLVNKSFLDRLGLKHALHGFYYRYKVGFMYRDLKYRFYKSHNFRKLTGLFGMGMIVKT